MDFVEEPEEAGPLDFLLFGRALASSILNMYVCYSIGVILGLQEGGPRGETMKAYSKRTNGNMTHDHGNESSFIFDS